MRTHLKAILLAGSMLLPLLKLSAADYTVSVYSGNLIPSALTVTVSDTVTFVNQDIMLHYFQDHSDPSKGFYLWEDDTATLSFLSTGFWRLDDLIGGDAIRITVTDAPPVSTPSITLNRPSIAPNGDLTIDVRGLTLNSTATLQVSTNLVDWQDVSTSTVTSETTTLTDYGTKSQMGFYRILQTP